MKKREKKKNGGTYIATATASWFRYRKTRSNGAKDTLLIKSKAIIKAEEK